MSGIASRRKCERLISDGKVKVNGQIINKLWMKVDPEVDIIEADGQQIIWKNQNKVYLLLNKPEGYITTVKDTHGRKTVMDLLPANLGRIYPVGRLDSSTTGLLLFTNDGELTYALTHPKHKFNKTYLACIRGALKDDSIKALENGILLEDGLTSKAKVKIVKTNPSTSLVKITIHEGKKRQVRRMFKSIGHPVISLKRIAMGFLTLNGVPEGKYRYLTLTEVQRLKNMYQNNIKN